MQQLSKGEGALDLARMLFDSSRRKLTMTFFRYMSWASLGAGAGAGVRGTYQQQWGDRCTAAGDADVVGSVSG